MANEGGGQFIPFVGPVKAKSLKGYFVRHRGIDLQGMWMYLKRSDMKGGERRKRTGQMDFTEVNQPQRLH
ncbi:MAG: hypothetical protein D6778_01765 [Nitrospirae bacterium]|nr:MAG: hypothetical protein D6778_01765 [Nitrospirota bacterium]